MISFQRSIRKERANQPPFPSMFSNLLNFSFMDLFNCPGFIIRYFPSVKKEQTKLFQSCLLCLAFQVPEHSSVFKKQLQSKQTSLQSAQPPVILLTYVTLTPPQVHPFASVRLCLPWFFVLCGQDDFTPSNFHQFVVLEQTSIYRLNPRLCCWHILCNILEE